MMPPLPILLVSLNAAVQVAMKQAIPFDIINSTVSLRKSDSLYQNLFYPKPVEVS
jgi:hypothetical protein